MRAILSILLAATTPNMGLPVDQPGVTPYYQSAVDAETTKDLIDQHDHSPGKGVPVTPAGMNIDAPLNFEGIGGDGGPQSAIGLRFLGMTDAGAGPGVYLSLWTDGNNLWYEDGSGDLIELTSNGVVPSNPLTTYLNGSLTVDGGVTLVAAGRCFVTNYGVQFCDDPSGDAVISAVLNSGIIWLSGNLELGSLSGGTLYIDGGSSNGVTLAAAGSAGNTILDALGAGPIEFERLGTIVGAVSSSAWSFDLPVNVWGDQFVDGGITVDGGALSFVHNGFITSAANTTFSFAGVGSIQFADAFVSVGFDKTAYLELAGGSIAEIATSAADLALLPFSGVTTVNGTLRSSLSALNLEGVSGTTAVNLGANGTDYAVITPESANGPQLGSNAGGLVLASHTSHLGVAATGTAPACPNADLSGCWGSGATCTVTPGSSDLVGSVVVQTASVTSNCSINVRLLSLILGTSYGATPSALVMLSGDSDAGASPGIAGMFPVPAAGSVNIAPIVSFTPNTLSQYTFDYWIVGIGASGT